MSLGENMLGVSAVIPAFNYARYLPVAVASVLEQTHPRLELIIIDDGSTDDTGTVCATFTDPRVRYVRQVNGGLSAARNAGIREARYDFVAFLDADDRWESEFLERALEKFAALPVTFGAIATAAVRMNSAGDIVQSVRATFGRDGELLARDFCLRNRPLSSNIVLRKVVFAESGDFDTSLRSSEDRDMWIRLTSRGSRFWFIDSPLAAIRRHDANMSRNAPRMMANGRRVLIKARADNAVPRWSLFWLCAYSVHFYQTAWTHRNSGFRIRGFAYLLTSWLLWPCFLRTTSFGERPLFRLRALANFVLR